MERKTRGFRRYGRKRGRAEEDSDSEEREVEEEKGKEKEKEKATTTEKEKKGEKEPTLDELLLQEQQESNRGYAAPYKNWELLDGFLPDTWTPLGRRTSFVGIPREMVHKSLPSLVKWYDEEITKKANREVKKNRAIYDRDKDKARQAIPLDHIPNSANTKQSTLGQFFAFIRLIEGPKTKLILDDLFDPVKVLTFLEFIRR